MIGIEKMAKMEGIGKPTEVGEYQGTSRNGLEELVEGR
jgi:hypothetical protein